MATQATPLSLNIRDQVSDISRNTLSIHICLACPFPSRHHMPSFLLIDLFYRQQWYTTQRNATNSCYRSGDSHLRFASRKVPQFISVSAQCHRSATCILFCPSAPCSAEMTPLLRRCSTLVNSCGHESRFLASLRSCILLDTAGEVLDFNSFPCQSLILASSQILGLFPECHFT